MTDAVPQALRSDGASTALPTTDLRSAGAASAMLAFCARELQKLGRYDLAAQVARLVIGENENSADAHSLLAGILDELGQWPEALTHWQRAAELVPDAPLARFNLALALLRLGDYQPGFPLHEARVARPDWTCRGAGLSGRELYEARIDKPDWTGFSALPSRAAERARLLRAGEPIAGRTILVLTEQGLGDCIMFARYVPLLAERGARVVLACSPPLRDIFSGITGIAELLSPPPEQPTAKINLAALAFDAWVPLLSLPLHVGDSGTKPVANVPYLHFDPTRRAEWRRRYEAQGRRAAAKVGLVFQANPAGRIAANKSLRPGDLAPLLELGGIDWVVLQQGQAGRDLAAAHTGAIDALASEMSLDEFAAAVAATDLVVTVDTMAAHCAGAIGHPAWVAVPFNPHWYWGIGSATTPWYPTFTLFRQDAPREWSGTIRRMSEELRARIQATRAHGGHRTPAEGCT